MSLGQDNTDVAFQVRAETIPNAVFSVLQDEGSPCRSPAERRSLLDLTVAEGRKAVQELSAKKVDLVKI
jgi:hypothetical protein